jgi:hypothetical protein
MPREWFLRNRISPLRGFQRTIRKAIWLLLFAAGFSKIHAQTATPTAFPPCNSTFYVSRNMYFPATDLPQLFVRCDLCFQGPYSVKVYNSAGEKVKTLRDNSNQPAGPDQVPWDGKNDAQVGVASGVYIIVMIDTFTYHEARVVVIR